MCKGDNGDENDTLPCNGTLWRCFEDEIVFVVEDIVLLSFVLLSFVLLLLVFAS